MNNLSYEEIIEDVKFCEALDKKKVQTITKQYEAKTSYGTLTITQRITGDRCYSVAVVDPLKPVIDKTIASSYENEKSALRWLKTECKYACGLYNERIFWKDITNSTH